MNNEPIKVPPSVTKVMSQLDALMRDPGLEIQAVSPDTLTFVRFSEKEHYLDGQPPRSLASWMSECNRQDMLDWLYERAVSHKLDWAVLCRQSNETLTECYQRDLSIDCFNYARYLCLALEANTIEAAKHLLTLIHGRDSRWAFMCACAIIQMGIAADELLLLIPEFDCNYVGLSNNTPFALMARFANLGLINRYLQHASQENINVAFSTAVQYQHTDVALTLLPHIDCIQKVCVNEYGSPLQVAALADNKQVVNAILVAGIVDYRDERNAPAAPEFLKGKRKGCSKMDKVKASNALIAVIQGEVGEETLKPHMTALKNKRLKKFYGLYLTYVKGTGKKPANQRPLSERCEPYLPSCYNM